VEEQNEGSLQFVADQDPVGVVLSGAALAQAGLQAAQLNPDHTVLYLARAL
jgi:hypothetical protein